MYRICVETRPTDVPFDDESFAQWAKQWLNFEYKIAGRQIIDASQVSHNNLVWCVLSEARRALSRINDAGWRIGGRPVLVFKKTPRGEMRVLPHTSYAEWISCLHREEMIAAALVGCGINHPAREASVKRIEAITSIIKALEA